MNMPLRNHTMVPAIALRELLEYVQDTAKVADMLGVSTSLISENLSKESCRKVTEVAAEGLLAKLRAATPVPAAEVVTFVVTVPKAKEDAFRGGCQFIGVSSLAQMIPE
jgi:hypothetical protein